MIPTALALVLAATPSIAAPPHRCEAAQLAIERVYWEHRVWPAENPGPRPPFESVISPEAIASQVDDDLRKGVALQRLYGRSIGSRDLQAELDRMAAHTRAPGLLRDLFQALGNDASMVAECLVRPVLADRLLRDSFDRDDRIHAEVRDRAGSFARSESEITRAEEWGARYEEMTYRRALSGRLSLRHEASEEVPAVELDEEQWTALRASLASPVPGAASGAGGASQEGGGTLPLLEQEQAISSRRILADGVAEMTVGTATWPKVAFESWWESRRSDFQADSPAVEALTVALPMVQTGACPAGTWDDTLGESPEPRHLHAAVWTGSEMFVWGGYGYGTHLRTGYLYDPATDVWRPTSIDLFTPTARGEVSAVWTGTQIIVWGGYRTGTWLNDGARFEPASNRWLPLDASGTPPSPRAGQSTVWTGAEMIVWGGYNGSAYLQTGGRFNPASGAWTATRVDAMTPVARSVHSAVWTGEVMIVTGGYNLSFPGQGGRYHPGTDTWRAMRSDPGSIGQWPVTVWTGTRMIVWGGWYFSYSNKGGIYDPVLDTWTPTRQDGSTPQGRYAPSGVWTGSEMIIWGGRSGSSLLNTGSRFDPISNTWTSITQDGAPRGRELQTAIWAGSEMIIWGGLIDRVGSLPAGTGGRYDPSTDHWMATAWRPGPTARISPASAWTGAEMLVFGGLYYEPLGDGMLYRPALDAWSPLPIDAAPVPRSGASAVWTGRDVIVWGGYSVSNTLLNTGGRYDPLRDMWTPMGTGGAPHKGHPVLVWTGLEMIAWGGYTTSGPPGAMYEPVSDTWWPMPSPVEGPAQRTGHATAWTGSEMVVWGGEAGYRNYVRTGGRYNPRRGEWAEISTEGAPSARSGMAAVWTGSEMIVWGGSNGSPLADGARYNPLTDSWLPLSAEGPAARSAASAAWTGEQMLVWGGTGATASVKSGGIYTPATDAWIPMGEAGSPQGRSGHSTAWTGSQMLVWGGRSNEWAHPFADGGSFAPCPCADPDVWYPDRDHDGFGDPDGEVVLACEPASGLAGNALDCNEESAAVYPGAPQLCGDGLNNDCSAAGWPAMAETNENDDDGDAVSECEGDCNDRDGHVHPGATEVCQGLDDDCDGIVDEELQPGIVSVRLSPDRLWPPNHRMVEVMASVKMTGGCLATCAGPSVVLDAAVAGEADDDEGADDGQTEHDIQGAEIGTEDLAFGVRAERRGSGTGRFYRFSYAVTDCAGQTVTGEGGVFVPHDQSGVAEPIDVAFTPDGALEWTPIQSAEFYNVVRGRLQDVEIVGSWTVLTGTRCLASRTRATSLAPSALGEGLDPGEAFFYLVDSFDGAWSGYGSFSGEKETVILSGESCH